MVYSNDLRDLSEQVTKAVEVHSSTNNDPATYDNALAAIQRLQLAVEKPGDFVARLRFQVCLRRLKE